MQLHEIKPIHPTTKKKRVGRGGKKGTYSGRGVKGQKSRSGARIRPAWRDLIKRIPKKRGYKFKPVSSSPAVVNLSEIEKKFKGGEVVSPLTLAQRGLVRKVKGKIPTIKILGAGELTKGLTFKGLNMSKGAELRSGSLKKEAKQTKKETIVRKSKKSKK